MLISARTHFPTEVEAGAQLWARAGSRSFLVRVNRANRVQDRDKKADTLKSRHHYRQLFFRDPTAPSREKVALDLDHLAVNAYC